MKQLHLVSLIVLFSVTLSSCATNKSSINQFGELQEKRGANNQQTIVIMGLNDIHGALFPQEFKSKEDDETKAVLHERGGAAILASHIKILRSIFGQSLLVVDAGDEFQGSLESNIEEGSSVVKFLNAIDLTAATIGNHEFDFGPETKNALNPTDLTPAVDVNDKLGALKRRISEAKFSYVVSNIKGLPNVKTRHIVSVGNLKIGFIGLTTPTTPSITTADYVKGLVFANMKKETLQEASELRKEGAQIIVLIAHAGMNCSIGKASAADTLRKPTDPLGFCDPKEEVAKLLRSLPAGTVDAVVSGHSHQIVHHWFPEGFPERASLVPVIQGGSRANYYNLIFLTYDWNTGKLLTEKTRIQGPVPVCEKIFENQNDCNGSRPAPKEGRGRLVTPAVFGSTVRPDRDIENLLEPVFEKVKKEKERVVGTAAKTVEHIRTSESPLGNLVADAIRNKLGADFAFVNTGGIRANLEAGPITYEAVFRVLPFDNSVSLLELNGKELKLMFRIIENGARGFFPISGARLRLLDPKSPPPSSDLNGDKRIEPWEVDRLLGITTSDGKPINDNAIYKVATIDFLIQGGDDLSWVMSKIPPSRIHLATGGILRDVVAEYIGQNSPINSDATPLISRHEPRLTFEKKALKQGKKTKKKKSRKHR